MKKLLLTLLCVVAAVSSAFANVTYDLVTNYQDLTPDDRVIIVSGASGHLAVPSTPTKNNTNIYYTGTSIGVENIESSISIKDDIAANLLIVNFIVSDNTVIIKNAATGQYLTAPGINNIPFVEPKDASNYVFTALQDGNYCKMSIKVGTTTGYLGFMATGFFTRQSLMTINKGSHPILYKEHVETAPLSFNPNKVSLTTNPIPVYGNDGSVTYGNKAEVQLKAKIEGQEEADVLNAVTYSFKDAEGNVYPLNQDNKVATYDPATKLLTSVGAGNISLVASYVDPASLPANLWNDAALRIDSAPGTVDFSNNDIKITLSAAAGSYDDVYLYTGDGVALENGKRYKFEYDITSNGNTPTVCLGYTYYDSTVGYNKDKYFFENNATVHEFDCNIDVKDLLLYVNIAAYPAGSEITISNISLTEVPETEPKPITAECAVTVNQSVAILYTDNGTNLGTIIQGGSCSIPNSSLLRIKDASTFNDITSDYYTLTYTALSADSDEETDIVSVTDAGDVIGKIPGSARVKVEFSSKYFTCANPVKYFTIVVEKGTNFFVEFNSVQGAALVQTDENGGMKNVYSLTNYNNGQKKEFAIGEDSNITYYLLPAVNYEFTEVYDSGENPLELEYDERFVRNGKQIGFISFDFDNFSPVYSYIARSTSVTDDQAVTFMFGGENKNVDTKNGLNSYISEQDGVAFFNSSKTFTEPGGAVVLSFTGNTPAGYSAAGEYLFLGNNLEFSDGAGYNGTAHMMVGFTGANQTNGSVLKKIVFDYAEGSAKLAVPAGFGFMSEDGTIWAADENDLAPEPTPEPAPAFDPGLWADAQLSCEWYSYNGSMEYNPEVLSYPNRNIEMNLAASSQNAQFYNYTNLNLEKGKTYTLACDWLSSKDQGGWEGAQFGLCANGGSDQFVKINVTAEADKPLHITQTFTCANNYNNFEIWFLISGNTDDTKITVSNISLTEVTEAPAAAPAVNIVNAIAQPINAVTFTPVDGNVKLSNISVSYDGPKLPTNIETIEATDADATPVFYNLQGVRVQNPANGIFIRVCGNKVDKVLVK